MRVELLTKLIMGAKGSTPYWGLQGQCPRNLEQIEEAHWSIHSVACPNTDWKRNSNFEGLDYRDRPLCLNPGQFCKTRKVVTFSSSNSPPPITFHCHGFVFLAVVWFVSVSLPSFPCPPKLQISDCRGLK
ncbi:hypothetical protein MRB53_014131 [Persea americana]|uniref:Uncharacterized protein n=1 Tax=Persea americana TaxID=3435 RepID=A0ACC2KA20_PERAE|nr:hypothetical protein MRB53_014131 [Persea americana]